MRVAQANRFALTTLIALTLVVAQLAGLMHRLEHPGLGHDGVLRAWTAAIPLDEHAHSDTDQHDHEADQETGGTDTHRCAAYDAATLGDAPPLAIAAAFAAPRVPQAPITRVAGLTTGVAAVGYHSRAPPRA